MSCRYRDIIWLRMIPHRTPFYLYFCFLQFVTQGQLKYENINEKFQKSVNMQTLICRPFWVAWWNLTLSHCVHPGMWEMFLYTSSMSIPYMPLGTCSPLGYHVDSRMTLLAFNGKYQQRSYAYNVLHFISTDWCYIAYYTKKKWQSMGQNIWEITHSHITTC